AGVGWSIRDELSARRRTAKLRRLHRIHGSQRVGLRPLLHTRATGLALRTALDSRVCRMRLHLAESQPSCEDRRRCVAVGRTCVWRVEKEARPWAGCGKWTGIVIESMNSTPARRSQL